MMADKRSTVTNDPSSRQSVLYESTCRTAANADSFLAEVFLLWYFRCTPSWAYYDCPLAERSRVEINSSSLQDHISGFEKIASKMFLVLQDSTCAQVFAKSKRLRRVEGQKHRLISLRLYMRTSLYEIEHSFRNVSQILTHESITRSIVLVILLPKSTFVAPTASVGTSLKSFRPNFFWKYLPSLFVWRKKLSFCDTCFS